MTTQTFVHRHQALWAAGNEALAHGDKVEAERLWAEGDKLLAQSEARETFEHDDRYGEEA